MSRKTPLSIESLLEAQRKEKEALSKPKFLSKAERAALALEKRAKQVEAQKEREASSSHPSTGSIESKFGQQPSSSGVNGHGSLNYDDRPAQPRAMRQQNGHAPDASTVAGAAKQLNGHRDASTTLDSMDSNPADRQGGKLTLAELAAQQSSIAAAGPVAGSSNGGPILNEKLQAQRYLGAKQPDKRKRQKQTDNKRFNFDWDKDDDTAADEVDPIYAPYVPPTSSKETRGRERNARNDQDKPIVVPTPPAPIPKLFGRGHLAGFDRDLPGITDRKAKGGMDDRHWSEKRLDEMRDRDWRIFREDFSIAARGGHIPHPLRSWTESDIPHPILDVIEEIGYKEPSPIQRQAIPIGLQNRDLIGIAETGSGKTAAFVIPMLTYIGKLPPLTEDNRGLGPYALVLAPTRELAQQIESETNKFTKSLGYRCVSIVGGKDIEEQSFSLRHGAEIIIATPGRLKDCIERSILVLSQCTYVVMDEADRMVGLGFEEILNFILDSLPVTNEKPDTEEAEDATKLTQMLDGDNASLIMYRQTVMFSATMPAAVERLAKKYLRRPAIVTIGVAGQAVDRVEQRIEFIASEERKRARLIDILNSGAFVPPIMVFVNTKAAADQLAREIQRAHWSATTLHSGKNQSQREAALNSIRNGENDVLVATDLAGRGIDVPDVSLVVNFQMSNTIEAYVHRIGRTGRAGKSGTAITFVNDTDEEVLYDLKQEVSKSKISKVPPELARHPAAQQRITAAMKRARDEDQ